MPFQLFSVIDNPDNVHTLRDKANMMSTTTRSEGVSLFSEKRNHLPQNGIEILLRDSTDSEYYRRYLAEFRC